MLKLGCTVLSLVNSRLHKSSSAKFYPFSETDEDLLQKIREDMVGGPSIVLRLKALVNETFIRNLGNIYKSIVGIDGSQLYPVCVSPCQQDDTRDTNMTQNLMDLNLKKTNLETLRTCLCYISKDKDPTVKLSVSTLQELRKRLIASK